MRIEKVVGPLLYTVVLLWQVSVTSWPPGKGLVPSRITSIEFVFGGYVAAPTVLITFPLLPTKNEQFESVSFENVGLSDTMVTMPPTGRECTGKNSKILSPGSFPTTYDLDLAAFFHTTEYASVML